MQEHNIAFVIDLHGMTNRHRMGVAVGTMHGRACDADTILEPFLQAGFTPAMLPELTSSGPSDWQRLVVDHPRFTGGIRNHTVTRYACESLGVRAVQIELSSAARIVISPATADWPREYSGDLLAIYAAFSALVSLIKQESR